MGAHLSGVKRSEDRGNGLQTLKTIMLVNSRWQGKSWQSGQAGDPSGH